MSTDDHLFREGHRATRDGLSGVDAGKWRNVVLQTARDLWSGNILEWSASLAFYSIISLFPLLISGLVLASFVVNGGWATRETIDLLGQFMPGGEGEIEAIVNAAIANRRQAGLLSLVLLILTGRRILGTLTSGLNHVSDVDKKADSLVRRALVELSLAAGLVVLGVLALLSRRLIAAVWTTLEILPGPDDILLRSVRGRFA